MEVQRGGGVGNMVSRRYSEFVKLHRLLLASHPAQYVPPLNLIEVFGFVYRDQVQPLSAFEAQVVR